ncbi:39S ribosomal protein L54, mitochondrial [Maniola jurtina]|uniref:39S ribosomal protein L54, mitochondrial n=1 Tax=Maniola jurtina TaxID=191418 RepID=UPI001E68A3A0|nr:39S ribosomal protein L54, mitochondrial [Maniola jurtina]XP_045761921.1 39S ribosomal protein L54, mitochondrial [Maniola jurtina]
MLKILLTSTKATPRIFQSQIINCNSLLCIASVHSNSPNCAVKKTTTAAGGVLGLGKGKKKLGKLGSMEKKQLPVETDPEKLVNYVCGSNIYITGEDVKIKDDSEYPDWLWTLNTGKPPRIEDLDPNTKQYWIRVRAAGMRRNNKLRSMRKF